MRNEICIMPGCNRVRSGYGHSTMCNFHTAEKLVAQHARTEPSEPLLPPVTDESHDTLITTPALPATIVLIDYVTQSIITLEVFSRVIRAFPERAYLSGEDQIERRIACARAAGALVVERHHLNADFFPAQTDYSDSGEPTL